MTDDNIARNLCWYCKSEIGCKHFCDHCVKIQPLIDDIDYFRFMGLQRKLNIDLTELERRYYELSKRFHPDYYQNQSGFERLVSRDKSSLLNEAYATLKDPMRRAEYMMRLEGINIEKNNTHLSPDFIAEVFGLQEKIEEFESVKKEKPQSFGALETELREVEKSLNGKIEKLKNDLLKLFVLWDGIFFVSNQVTEEMQEKKIELIERIKDLIEKQLYLESVKHNLLRILT